MISLNHRHRVRLSQKRNNKKLSAMKTSYDAEGIAADYDSCGRSAGIEMLDAAKRFGDQEMFRQVVHEQVSLGSEWNLSEHPAPGVLYETRYDTQQMKPR